MNLFDKLQDTAFNVVTNTMGYTATWIPTAGGAEKVATVLFNGPSDKEKLADASYSPEKIWMEYKAGDFDGLKESADDSNFETITISGIGVFVIKSIDQKYDGKTFVAYLNKKED